MQDTTMLSCLETMLDINPTRIEIQTYTNNTDTHTHTRTLARTKRKSIHANMRVSKFSNVRMPASLHLGLENEMNAGT